MIDQQTIYDKIAEHLHGPARVMQLATVADGKPWICSVYFVADEALNLYWLSWPERRHSQELAKCSDIAATIAIKTNQPVVGVQLSGVAEVVVELDHIEKAVRQYTEKYGLAKTFMDRAVEGRNHHQVYKITPSYIQLFDEQDFPRDSPLQIDMPGSLQPIA